MYNTEFWSGKSVLITGHTGFKGSWLVMWLDSMGAKIVGYALDPYTDKDNFVISRLSDRLVDIRGDICDYSKLKDVFDTYKPEIVFHLAAQPLVRKSYEEPVETYSVNVMGTMHVLECIRHTDSVKEAIIITTDKCYANKEQIWGYRECDELGGYDPYSSSKACAEILVDSYRNSYFNIEKYDEHKKAIATVRAGNVIGGGDWSTDRLIPDCIKAFFTDKTVEIRAPKSIRPWQHVLDALSGYILLAEKLWFEPVKYRGGWNFGPDMTSFKDVWTVVNKVIKEIEMGRAVDCSDKEHVHEAELLFLDTTKARLQLGWSPVWDIDETVKQTVDWYKTLYNESDSANMYEYGMNQIYEYVKAMKEKK
ncbi:MAG: CDP-glucose 4,6-dehydratase [Lachnospiraceae bacterium]|nr:CDP-glucose 4,6-dehydratase [Lachnospiraceae bacterium]